MKTVQRKIESIIEQMGISYQLIPLAEIKQEMFENNSPICIHIPAMAGVFTNLLAQYKDAPTTQIGFIFPVKEGSSEIEKEKVIQEMKESTMKFIELYNESGFFKPIIGEVPYQVLSADSEEVSFVGISVTIVPGELTGITFSYS